MDRYSWAGRSFPAPSATNDVGLNSYLAMFYDADVAMVGASSALPTSERSLNVPVPVLPGYLQGLGTVGPGTSSSGPSMTSTCRTPSGTTPCPSESEFAARAVPISRAVSNPTAPDVVVSALDMQVELAMRGFYTGPVDGIAGPNTVRAMLDAAVRAGGPADTLIVASPNGGYIMSRGIVFSSIAALPVTNVSSDAGGGSGGGGGGGGMLLLLAVVAVGAYFITRGR